MKLNYPFSFGLLLLCLCHAYDAAMECYTWNWFTTFWSPSSNLPEACNETVCSLPKDRGIQSAFTERGGCGPCKDNSTCLETESKLNSDENNFIKCYTGEPIRSTDLMPPLSCYSISTKECVRPRIYEGAFVDSNVRKFGCVEGSLNCSDVNTCKTCNTNLCNKWPSMDDVYKRCVTGNASTISEYNALSTTLCTTNSAKCTRPIIVSGVPVDSGINTFGCVENGLSCTDLTKCVLCSESECNTWPKSDDFLCKTGPVSNVKDYFDLPLSVCPEGSALCTRPVIVHGAPMNSATNTFGCVTANLTCSNSSECVSCSESECNIWPDAGSDYLVKCYTWTWSFFGWSPSLAPKPCYTTILGKLPVSCSLPRDRGTKSGFLGDGCGPCSDTATCLDTLEELNSGRLPTISVVLISLFLSLFF